MSDAAGAPRYRWLVLATFVLSSAINYLDRQTLAVLGPQIRADFHISTETFGWVLGVFSTAYAVTALFAGMMIDRVGLNLGASIAVGLWSCAGIATAFTRGLPGLFACRTVLGVAEAGGIPAAGKAIHVYLKPSERAMGNAMNQAGVSLGLIVAPPVAIWIASHYGWRDAFVVTGLLGLLWIPLWNLTARFATPVAAADPPSRPAQELLRDRRLWAFVVANAFTMVGYSLWTNFTVFYLVDVQHLNQTNVARYAWIPPVFALAGGFLGGWASARWIDSGLTAPAARFRVCLWAAVVSLATALVPLAQTPGVATAAISLSFLAVAAMSANVYSLPLDTFGGSRAAFAISALVASYGAMQLVVSPAFGRIIDHAGYAPLMWIAALTPAAACLVLWRSKAIE